MFYFQSDARWRAFSNKVNISITIRYQILLNTTQLQACTVACTGEVGDVYSGVISPYLKRYQEILYFLL